MELVFKILRNTSIISELHPYLLVSLCHNLNVLEGNVLYFIQVQDFVMHLVKLSYMTNLVILVQLLITCL